MINSARTLQERGLFQYWDAISLHLYRTVTDGENGAPETALGVVNRTRRLLAEYPYGTGKDIVSGEWGYVKLICVCNFRTHGW
jgi:hypothetical protein